MSSVYKSYSNSSEKTKFNIQVLIFRSNQKCAVTVTANFLVFDDHTIITKLHRVQTKFDDFVLLRQGTDGEDGKSLDGQDKLEGSGSSKM